MVTPAGTPWAELLPRLLDAFDDPLPGLDGAFDDPVLVGRCELDSEVPFEEAEELVVLPGGVTPLQ